MTMPVPLEVTRYIRVAEMFSVQGAEGVFRACSSSPTRVCHVDRVGLFLHTETTTPGLDGFQATLTSKSLEAVKLAHLWKQWPEHLKNCSDFRSSKTFVKTGRKGKRKVQNIYHVVDGVTILDDDQDDEAPQHPEIPEPQEKQQSKKLLKQLHEKAEAAIKKNEEIPVPCWKNMLIYQ